MSGLPTGRPEGRHPELIDDLVILGGGTAGWMTAAAMAKLLQDKVRITVVESDEIGTVGVGEATIPMIALFNQLLEIDEDEFLRATQGTFKLGIEFVDWGRLGDRYMHGFGRLRQDMQLAGFDQYWQKRFQRGEDVDIARYSITRMAAAAGRFMRPRPDVPESPLSDLAHAFHFDASLYAAYLRRYAERRGVVRVEGRVVDVPLHGSRGDIAALLLEDGRRVDGDFFVDCSGFRGRLIEQALHVGYDDWSHWLPCDRAVAVPCAPVLPRTPFTRSTALAAGWQWRIPLQHRTGNGYVFSSRHIGEDEAAATLLARLDGEALAAPRTLRFVTGARRAAWSRNCVAIGLSGGFIEPLESTSIHLIQTAIGRLVTFFPGRTPRQADVDEHNRQARRELEHIRDFIVLHYHANQRTDAPMWAACRAMDIPESLRHRIALYEARGRIVREGSELFAETGWLQVMHGQGLRARGYHPLVDTADDAALGSYMDSVRRAIEQCVDIMPTHDAFIEQHCRAA